MFWKFAVPQLRRRSEKLQKFVDDNIKLSINQYDESNISEANAVYDGFVCGSDQIWNPELTELNSMYWLGFANENKKKIAYAPSIGVNNLTTNQRHTIKENLSTFCAISCREKDGTDLLNTVVNGRCLNVLDPTLVVEKSFWDSLSEGNTTQQKYLFAYILRGNKEQRQFIELFAKDRNLKIVTVPFLESDFIEWYDLKFGDIKRWDCGPDEFIGLIRNAEYVITDSYHGTVFSCIYHVPFFNLEKFGKAQSSRIQSLEKILEIEGRVVNSYEDISRIDTQKIDWNLVDANIEKEKQKSWHYLEKALS